MQRYSWLLVFAALVIALSSINTPAHSAPLSAELQKALDSSKYVYIQSARKDGSMGKAAEIWFFSYQGAVWVCSPVTTHRVKRIQAGQTKAKIAIGKSDGPSFTAKGSLVKDAAIDKVMFETFAKKYAGEWSSYEKNFRDGLANGTRTLVKYEPE
jgi:hypothetical protein